MVGILVITLLIFLPALLWNLAVKGVKKIRRYINNARNRITLYDLLKSECETIKYVAPPEYKKNLKEASHIVLSSTVESIYPLMTGKIMLEAETIDLMNTCCSEILVDNPWYALNHFDDKNIFSQRARVPDNHQHITPLEVLQLTAPEYQIREVYAFLVGDVLDFPELNMDEWWADWRLGYAYRKLNIIELQ